MNPFSPEGPLGEDENGDYRVEVAAAQLVRFLGETITGPFWLVGHSMGGKIALTAATQLPTLQGLILFAPSPPTPEPMSEAAREAMLQRHGTREGALKTIELATFNPLEGEKLERAIADDLATPDKDWENWLKHGTRQDVTSRVEGVDVPVLILGGEKDGGFTPEVLQSEVVANLPRAEVKLEVVTGSGHLIPLELPQKSARLIEDFINQYRQN